MTTTELVKPEPKHVPWSTRADPIEPDDAYPWAAQYLYQLYRRATSIAQRERIARQLGNAITGECRYEEHENLNRLNELARNRWHWENGDPK